MSRDEQELKTLACPPLVRLALVLLRLTSSKELNGRLMQQVDLFKEMYALPQGEKEMEAVYKWCVPSVHMGAHPAEVSSPLGAANP